MHGRLYVTTGRTNIRSNAPPPPSPLARQVPTSTRHAREHAGIFPGFRPNPSASLTRRRARTRLGAPRTRPLGPPSRTHRTGSPPAPHHVPRPRVVRLARPGAPRSPPRRDEEKRRQQPSPRERARRARRGGCRKRRRHQALRGARARPARSFPTPIRVRPVPPSSASTAPRTPARAPSRRSTRRTFGIATTRQSGKPRGLARASRRSEGEKSAVSDPAAASIPSPPPADPIRSRDLSDPDSKPPPPPPPIPRSARSPSPTRRSSRRTTLTPSRILARAPSLARPTSRRIASAR